MLSAVSVSLSFHSLISSHSDQISGANLARARNRHVPKSHPRGPATSRCREARKWDTATLRHCDTVALPARSHDGEDRRTSK